MNWILVIFLFLLGGCLTASIRAADEPVAASNHWAFSPPVRPAVPHVKQRSWVRNPIDAFILAKLESAGVTPVPEAERHVLIRRLHLDLTGLPPSAEAVKRFEQHSSPTAFEVLVEELLASPAYGERWGRHWLDWARWAETEGYEANSYRPFAWRYRDYVVQSFNSNLPYDFFFRQQVAGDELRPYSDENLIATGFLACGRLNNNEEDKLVQQNESLVDIANTVASIGLGLSLNCAQCHDHKFDPLTIRDYYRFQAFFVRGQVNRLLLRDSDLWKSYDKAVPAELGQAQALLESLMAKARLKIEPDSNGKPNREALIKKLNEDDQRLVKELDKKISGLTKELDKRKPQTWAYYSPATSPHTVEALPPEGMYPLPYEPAKLKKQGGKLLRRGDVHRPGHELDPGWPEIFPAAPGELTNRLELAHWMTSRNHPLFARVLVNFVWQKHFGRGLVPGPGDFGVRSPSPTHPELLDWLATEFVESNFDIKRLHRLIVSSSVYREASPRSAEAVAIDPEVNLYWRWVPRRLEGEAMRDSMLAASGDLDRRFGGESIAPEKEGSSLRRSLYLRQKRAELPKFQALFDPASTTESCPVRHVSTVPLQPLFLLNSEFSMNRARKFAQQLTHAGTAREQLAAAFMQALGRPPEEKEIAKINEFMEKASAKPEDALILYCQALFNLNEFVYLQ